MYLYFTYRTELHFMTQLHMSLSNTYFSPCLPCSLPRCSDEGAHGLPFTVLSANSTAESVFGSICGQQLISSKEELGQCSAVVWCGVVHSLFCSECLKGIVLWIVSSRLALCTPTILVPLYGIGHYVTHPIDLHYAHSTTLSYPTLHYPTAWRALCDISQETTCGRLPWAGCRNSNTSTP